ncbi:DsrE family protein [Nitrospira sp. Kam-Ns4a]
MAKVAIIVFADTETHEGLGRVVNALEAVKEFKEAQEDVQLIFDGAGPKWIPELSKPDHQIHGLYEAVKDRIAGACEFCAGAFGVKDKVVACGVRLAGEFDGHPSFKTLVSQGYQIITF